MVVQKKMEELLIQKFPNPKHSHKSTNTSFSFFNTLPWHSCGK